MATRAAAIGAYPFVTRDDAGVDELGRIAADDKADDGLRTEAAAAYARLTRDRRGIAAMQVLALRYLDASAKKREEADRALAADAAREKSPVFQQHDRLAKGYLGFARMFQAHIARIEVAIRCKEERACLAASLRMAPDDAAKHVSPYIRDVFDWTAEEQQELIAAARREVRQAILLALPRIAKLPCTACVDKLDLAIEAAGKAAGRDDLATEASMLRHYFAWAGTK